MKTIGAILAGGRSRRFGSPKCHAELGGQSLVERVLNAHKDLFDEVVIVTNDPESFGSLGVPLVPDSHEGRGPLGGIHAALNYAADQAIALAPCDAPYAVPGFYRILLEASANVDAVFPKSRGPLGYEPLFGWLAPALLPLLDRMLQVPGVAVHEFVEAIPRVRYLPIDATEPWGGTDLLFMNINTPEDMRRAEEHLSRIGEP